MASTRGEERETVPGSRNSMDMAWKHERAWWDGGTKAIFHDWNRVRGLEMKDETREISRSKVKMIFISHFRSWAIYYTEVTGKQLKRTWQSTILSRCGFRRIIVTAEQGID